MYRLTFAGIHRAVNPYGIMFANTLIASHQSTGDFGNGNALLHEIHAQEFINENRCTIVVFSKVTNPCHKDDS